MFIPPRQLQDDLRASTKEASKVSLKSSHLLIDRTVATEIFGDDLNVHLVYYPDRRALMLAPKSDKLFKQLHKAKQHMLKDRNAQGDKTVALHELLIDNEINSTDRELEYECQKALKILNIKL
ncbi:MAG: hypothetical protein AAGG68_12530 [Bacteroidota bacterium]